MCYCDGEPAAICESNVRKARKPHMCVECGTAISSGARYEHVKGLWEGRWSSFRTCMECVGLRWNMLDVNDCACWTYGQLYESVEYMDEIDEEIALYGGEPTELLLEGFKAMRSRMAEAKSQRRLAA